MVSRAQLLDLGYGEDAIRYRLRAGRLHRLYIGVYSVGHARLTGLGRWMAATLTCGDGALLSHWSAAGLAGIQPSARSHVDVSVAASGPRDRPGISLHRRRSLHPEDRSESDGIPVTSVARTLRDLAEVAPVGRLARAFEEAERLRVLDLRALVAVGERRRGRRGSVKFAELLGQRSEPPWTKSELERRFLELCTDAGLPAPVVNGRVLGFEVDFHWPGRPLVVEADGYAFHRTRAAFENDRRRDAALQVAGHQVLRLTKRRLEHHADDAMGEVMALMEPG